MAGEWDDSLVVTYSCAPPNEPDPPEFVAREKALALLEKFSGATLPARVEMLAAVFLELGEARTGVKAWEDKEADRGHACWLVEEEAETLRKQLAVAFGALMAFEFHSTGAKEALDEIRAMRSPEALDRLGDT